MHKLVALHGLRNLKGIRRNRETIIGPKLGIPIPRSKRYGEPTTGKDCYAVASDGEIFPRDAQESFDSRQYVLGEAGTPL
jgi:hypothetical protein